MLYLKLVTIPTQSPTLKAAIAATVTAPGSMKKPETIAAWERDEKPAAVAEKLLRTALDGAAGEVFAIAWAFDDAPPKCLSRGAPDDGQEAQLLRHWFELVTKEGTRLLHDGSPADWEVRWCGVGIRDFHLRFLWQRCVVLGVQPPFPTPHNLRPDDPRAVDLQYLWAGWDGRVSLDALCQALSIGGEGLPGAEVWSMVRAGKVGEVAEGAKRDVARMREAHRRLTFAGAATAAEAERAAA